MFLSRLISCDLRDELAENIFDNNTLRTCVLMNSSRTEIFINYYNIVKLDDV